MQHSSTTVATADAMSTITLSAREGMKRGLDSSFSRRARRGGTEDGSEVVAISWKGERERGGGGERERERERERESIEDMILLCFVGNSGINCSYILNMCIQTLLNNFMYCT